MTFYHMYCETCRSLLYSQPVCVTSYLLQTDCQSSDVTFPVKTDIRHQITYLKAARFTPLLQTKPAVTLRAFSLLQLTGLSVTSTTSWHTLMNFIKLSRTEFVSVNTNLWVWTQI